MRRSLLLLQPAAARAEEKGGGAPTPARRNSRTIHSTRANTSTPPAWPATNNYFV